MAGETYIVISGQCGCCSSGSIIQTSGVVCLCSANPFTWQFSAGGITQTSGYTCGNALPSISGTVCAQWNGNWVMDYAGGSEWATRAPFLGFTCAGISVSGANDSTWIMQCLTGGPGQRFLLSTGIVNTGNADGTIGYRGYIASGWNCLGKNTLYYNGGDTSGQCNTWPATITIFPA